MDIELECYLLAHVNAEGNYLYRLYRATDTCTVHGYVASEYLQKQLLKMLIEMVRPENVLEVSTFSSYSAICMVERLSEGGQLYTSGISDEMEDFTRP